MLRTRGLDGVELLLSDAHAGLKAAISKIFIGAAWQRSRFNFMRNVLARVRKVESQLDEVADRLEPRFPDVAAMLHDAKEDVLAFASFPKEHWTKIWSTNSIKRLNVEIKRRTRVVGIFPNDDSALRLITAVCVEAHEEWLVSESATCPKGPWHYSRPRTTPRSWRWL